MIEQKRRKKFERYQKEKKQQSKKKMGLVIMTILFLLSGFGLGLWYNGKEKGYQEPNSKEENINYQEYFYPTILTEEEKTLYKIENKELKEVGKVSKGVSFSISKDEYLDKGYFKIVDMDYYIDYKNIKESEEVIEDPFWKNYIPFNESVQTKEVTNLYKEEVLTYSLNEGITLPIVIKKEDSYGVIYKDKLYYIKKEEGNIIKSQNTELNHTTGFSALVYHATYDHTNSSEKINCMNANSTICLSDIQFEEQMKYLKENHFYTATMKDVERFIDGEVQLPERTVLITIDDGYFVDSAVKVLEKYDLHATLFLIGALSEEEKWKTNAWYSTSLELHSHTYNRHTPGICSGGQGSIMKCGNKEDLLEDLKKSREQLNGSTVFCYPFFEYNDYAIEVLKEAGFTMAFAGGRQKIKVGSNKMKLPRYGIINTSKLTDFIKVIY